MEKNNVGSGSSECRRNTPANLAGMGWPGQKGQPDELGFGVWVFGFWGVWVFCGRFIAGNWVQSIALGFVWLSSLSLYHILVCWFSGWLANRLLTIAFPPRCLFDASQVVIDVSRCFEDQANEAARSEGKGEVGTTSWELGSLWDSCWPMAQMSVPRRRPEVLRPCKQISRETWYLNLVSYVYNYHKNPYYYTLLQHTVSKIPGFFFDT